MVGYLLQEMRRRNKYPAKADLAPIPQPPTCRVGGLVCHTNGYFQDFTAGLVIRRSLIVFLEQIDPCVLVLG